MKIFRRKKPVSHFQRISYCESFSVSLNPISMKVMIRKERAGFTIFVELILFRSTETFRRGTLLCGVSENLLQRKSLWIKAEGSGVKGFPSKNFVSHSAKKLSRGTLPCFRKFLVSKFFKPKKRISPFSIENLFVNLLKNFVGEPFCVSQNFRYRKKIKNRRVGRREEVSRFSIGSFHVSQ